MVCKSRGELFRDYGPNWMDLVTIESGPFVDDCGNCDCRVRNIRENRLGGALDDGNGINGPCPNNCVSRCDALLRPQCNSFFAGIIIYPGNGCFGGPDGSQPSTADFFGLKSIVCDGPLHRPGIVPDNDRGPVTTTDTGHECDMFSVDGTWEYDSIIFRCTCIACNTPC